MMKNPRIVFGVILLLLSFAMLGVMVAAKGKNPSLSQESVNSPSVK